MSTASYVALFALIVMVVLYAIENRWSLAPLGLSIAATIAAVSEFALGRWALGIAGLGFAVVASDRWYVGRRREGHA
ncbi:MAG TPA: hypothetical protein VNV41_16120 [Candidatus Acidoferrales bacterium]|jgi:hypothetical protein|nr:hypothetical protein [Candidatus Acidoferrales bacterium]